MGQFRVLLEGVGGHGCQREQTDGMQVYGCRRMDCPDCLAQEFFEKMCKIASGVKGEIIHWPGDPSEVRDEFVREVNEVATYTVKTLDGSSPDEGKEVPYVSFKSAHRIRRGSFPK